MPRLRTEAIEEMIGQEEDMLLATATKERYLWQPEGREIRVGLDLNVVDGLLREVMSGFGSTPRRGVEVGGILLGHTEDDGTIAVTDYVRVDCSHELGSAYSLSEEERERFAAVVNHRQRHEDSANYAVGFFRSHTRDGLGLEEDDINLLEEYFPDGSSLILLVKPYATRACRAGFFFREGIGIRRESSYQEFPFRRHELARGQAQGTVAEESDTISSAASSQPDGGFSYAAADRARVPYTVNPESSSGIFGLNEPPTAAQPEGEPRPKGRGWILLPLSFVFLLLGVFLGIQVSVSVGQRLPSGLRPIDPIALSLNAAPSGESIHLRWDRSSGIIKSALRGRLIISEGGAEKTVSLTAEQLKFGSVIYHRGSPEVEFRFEVDVRERVTLIETLEFRAQ